MRRVLAFFLGTYVCCSCVAFITPTPALPQLTRSHGQERYGARLSYPRTLRRGVVPRMTGSFPDGEGTGIDGVNKNGLMLVAAVGVVTALVVGGAGGAEAATVAVGSLRGLVPPSLQGLLTPAAPSFDFGQYLSGAVDHIKELGPLGYFYFGALYVAAEILAIPAIPLTASSGYLFGVAGGTAIVLLSATIAAGISFLLGRTLLRSWVEGLLAENAKFAKIDRVLSKEGFKIILLLRLSPIFPFAISNYLYGLTSVSFSEYIAATMLGFAPGSLAYVYSGTVGKALTLGSDEALPWYVYGAGLALAVVVLQGIGKWATQVVAELEPGIDE
ncbi:unnamed protein product [Chrysoparadoxa australica]